MLLRPHRITRTDTLVLYTTLFRSKMLVDGEEDLNHVEGVDVQILEGRTRLDAIALGVAVLRDDVEDLLPNRRHPQSLLGFAAFSVTARLLDSVDPDRKSTRLNSSH